MHAGDATGRFVNAATALRVSGTTGAPLGPRPTASLAVRPLEVDGELLLDPFAIRG
jgi:hypothetical protein